MGAGGGEIPAASAGMTEKASAGMTEKAGAGMTEKAGAGMTELISRGYGGECGRGMRLGAAAAQVRPLQAWRASPWWRRAAVS